jgi:TonB-dependent SusC/RagA subfamily outer membrane receptor
MKKILPKKFLTVKKPPFYLGFIILLFISGFSFAKGSNGVLIRRTFAVEKTGEIAAPIKGKVTERSTNQSLPGVSVRVKGTNIGVVTDLNGNFTIDAPARSTLVFTYVGFETIEVPADGRGSLNIQLKASSSSLNEVVVVGYGTQKKTSVTAAVSTINTAEIAQKPVVNLTNALVGRASGLIATQGSGEPGFDGSGILIRGPATNGRTDPLTVVDGVPRDFSRLDPNTIETLTVLKDAAAVAPYGVAGANGVILITTKAGKSGKPTLTYSGYYGFQNPTSVPLNTPR